MDVMSMFVCECVFSMAMKDGKGPNKELRIQMLKANQLQ